MNLRINRLGAGEWILGSASILLLIDLFGLSWFAYRPQFHATAVMLGQAPSANGWQSFEVIGPLTLLVCLTGAAVWLLTATRRSPALPAVITTLLLPVSLVLAVLVAVRVLLDGPAVHLAQADGRNVITAQPGAYIGLLLSFVLFIGAFMGMRREGVAPEDAPRVIETVRVGQASDAGRA